MLIGMEFRSMPLSPGSSNSLLVLSRAGSEVMLHSIKGMLILPIKFQVNDT